MFRRIAGLVATAALLFPAPTLGATRAVTVGNDFFSPTTTNAVMGDTIEWTSTVTRTHTTTGNAPLNLWSETLSGGEDWPRVFPQAGTFAYHCNIHASMQGTIRIPVRVTPASGGLSTIFTVRVATVAAPAGHQYVIQRRKNNGLWRAWRTTTAPTAAFDPASTGAWWFRSRLKRISDGATSGFSPAKKAVVS